jgi:hypothetical protein
VTLGDLQLKVRRRYLVPDGLWTWGEFHLWEHVVHLLLHFIVLVGGFLLRACWVEWVMVSISFFIWLVVLIVMILLLNLH